MDTLTTDTPSMLTEMWQEGTPSEDKMTLDQMPPEVQWLAAVVTLTVAVIALAGNAYVILVIYKNRSAHTSLNLLVVNLCVSNLLLAFTTFPVFITSNLQTDWKFVQTGCTLYGASSSLFGLTSMNTMAAIALQQMVMTWGSIKSRSIGLHTYVIIAVVWIFSASWAILPLMGAGQYDTKVIHSTCFYDYASHKENEYFLLCVLIGGYILPFVLICVAYVLAVYSFKQFFKHMNSQIWKRAVNSHSKQRSVLKAHRRMYHIKKREYRVMKADAMVILATLLSIIPYAITVLWYEYSENSVLAESMIFITSVVSKFATIWNPIVYTFAHPYFKCKMPHVNKSDPEEEIEEISDTKCSPTIPESKQDQMYTYYNRRKQVIAQWRGSSSGSIIESTIAEESYESDSGNEGSLSPTTQSSSGEY